MTYKEKLRQLIGDNSEVFCSIDFNNICPFDYFELKKTCRYCGKIDKSKYKNCWNANYKNEPYIGKHPLVLNQEYRERLKQLIGDTLKVFDIDLFIQQIRKIVQERDEIYKEYCDDICKYCKNEVVCNSKECEGYISGNEGYLDGKLTKFKWDCRDFDYGTCSMMENSPCFKCFENNYSGFQYDSDYDLESTIKQLTTLYCSYQSFVETEGK